MSRKSSVNKIKRDNTKSKNIESSLCMYLYEKTHSPITTHFNGMLNECDVISISKSDYIYEYEIKISKSDFKRDFIKEKHSNIVNEKFTYINKGVVKFLIPNYFTYVVPTNLISIDDIPDYAGLIYFNEEMKFDVIKKPPLLHKTKASNEFIRNVAHNLSCKLVFTKLI